MSTNAAEVAAKAKQAASAAGQKRLFTLSDIPEVMQQRLRWTMAGTLMRRWFNSPAYEMSEDVKRGRTDPATLKPTFVDESSVTMAWVLGFTRMRLAFDRLLMQWNSAAGVDRLKGHIFREAGKRARKTCWSFGDLSQPPRALERNSQVNFISVGDRTDPLDDFYGAMGRATLNVAVRGTVDSNATGHVLTVSEVGVYLRDTYDFIDAPGVGISQPLGYWGWNGVESGWGLRRDIAIDPTQELAPVDSMYEVQNDDFRRFRSKSGRGGDFLVYSDVRRIPLSRPLAFRF